MYVRLVFIVTVTVKIVTMTAMTMTIVVFFYMPDSSTRLRKSGLTEHLSLCNPHQLMPPGDA